MPIPSIFMLFGWKVGGVVSVVPSTPGLEYTASDQLPHYTAPNDRAHYTADDDLAHYTAPAED